jgi:2-haloacid dehalogenase
MDARTLIFDFGGVLVEWDPRLVYRRLLDNDDAIARFFEEVGFFAWNLEQDRGRPWPEAVSQLCARFPHHRDLIRAYDERWEESIVGPIEGTVRILERLRAKNFPLVGLTNWSPAKFAQTRGRYEFFTLFDDIIVSGEIGLVKPDPAIFEWTLRRIGRTAPECIFIDDSHHNVNAAAAMGFDAIQFRSPTQLEEELRARGIL